MADQPATPLLLAPASPPARTDEPPDQAQGGGTAPAQSKEPPLPEPWRLRPAVALLIAMAMVVLIGSCFLIGAAQRMRRDALLQKQQGENAPKVARVRCVTPTPGALSTTIMLPGALTPLRQTAVLARATGYVRSWSKDLGDSVKQGDELAVIDAPDIDQELAQAIATLEQSRLQVLQAASSEQFAQLSLSRQKSLGPQLTTQQLIDSQQSAADIATASLSASRAQVAANEANVARLRDLVGFTHVFAPFDGVVTARYVEVGNLVGTAGSTQALFQVSQSDPLRMFVDVPQAQAFTIVLGLEVQVSVREQGDVVHPGTVTHIARLLDPGAHTMVIEVQIHDPQHRLLPGMYATASISVPVEHRLLMVPSSTLLLTARGSELALVTREQHIHHQQVVIAMDTGSQLGISAGLEPDDRVIISPGEDMAEGTLVAPIEEQGGDGPSAALSSSPASTAQSW